MVHLSRRKWIEPGTYPRFAMIGQSLGSIYLPWEALNKFTPQFYFDTSGYAFTYPLAWLFGCKVICYTHYPTISSDMVERVKQRNSVYKNNSLSLESTRTTNFKSAYLWDFLFIPSNYCTIVVPVLEVALEYVARSSIAMNLCNSIAISRLNRVPKLHSLLCILTKSK